MTFQFSFLIITVAAQLPTTVSSWLWHSNKWQHLQC